MSIAVSAVVQPSRIVFFLTLGMSVGSVLIGLFLGLNAFGPTLLWARMTLAALCGLSGLTAACRILQDRCAQRIEISGSGQIRVYAASVPPSNRHEPTERIGSADCPQDLLPSSTLWSHLMILNLRADNGVTTTLLILPDTMSQTSFRALSVACHWIAAHNNRAESHIK